MAENLHFFMGPSVVEGDTRSVGFACEIPRADGKPMTGRYLGGIVVEQTRIRPQSRGRLKPRRSVERQTYFTGVRQGDPANPQPGDPILLDLSAQPAGMYFWLADPGVKGARNPYLPATVREFDITEACVGVLEDMHLMERVRAVVLDATVEPPHC